MRPHVANHLNRAYFILLISFLAPVASGAYSSFVLSISAIFLEKTAIFILPPQFFYPAFCLMTLTKSSNILVSLYLISESYVNLSLYRIRHM